MPQHRMLVYVSMAGWVLTASFLMVGSTRASYVTGILEGAVGLTLFGIAQVIGFSKKQLIIPFMGMLALIAHGIVVMVGYAAPGENVDGVMLMVVGVLLYSMMVQNLDPPRVHQTETTV